MAAVRPAVDYFAANDCDTIILGCTHFTHIADDIQVVKDREGEDMLRVCVSFTNNTDETETTLTLFCGSGKKYYFLTDDNEMISITYDDRVDYNAEILGIPLQYWKFSTDNSSDLDLSGLWTEMTESDKPVLITGAEYTEPITPGDG